MSRYRFRAAGVVLGALVGWFVVSPSLVIIGTPIGAALGYLIGRRLDRRRARSGA
jgi:uncharacterized protein YqgC (DUF456 family)